MQSMQMTCRVLKLHLKFYSVCNFQRNFLYVGFLATVPLVKSSGGDGMQIDTDEYENRMTQTAFFGDFAIQFLDKLFTLLSHKDKAEKNPGGEWWMSILMQVYWDMTWYLKFPVHLPSFLYANE